MRVHPSITLAKITTAVERWQHTLANPGFCIACGHEVDGVEPDARGYDCESCGERHVYGASELLMMVAT